MKDSVRKLVSVILFLVAAQAANAEDVESRSYSVANRGDLQIKVPKSWRANISEASTNIPPTIRFTPESGAGFEILVTPIWKARPNAELPSVKELKESVEKAAEAVQIQSVETTLQTSELKGPSAVGYYFSATDKAPKSGEFRYMTQGMLRVGDIVASFTVLSNDETHTVTSEAIAAFKTVLFHPKAADSSITGAKPVRPDAIQINSDETDYILTVPVSRLIVRIPKGSLKLKTNGPSGATASLRYFYFEDVTTPLIISGWFEKADGYKGVKKMWSDEVNAWQQKGLPAPQDVTFSKVGLWDVVNYNVLRTDPTPTHIRAYLVQAGTWIDLHISIGNTESIRNPREQVNDVLRGISVNEKTRD